ncbi:MAG: CinA family protein [Bacteroidales bacterium]|nr:CinA family protein [Bacteroidales bacterium]
MADSPIQILLGRMLKEKHLSLSVAESCTGGNISRLITSVPGASEYYLGGVTSYANSVKENVLGVPEPVIARYGAVSSECVAEMADGVRRLTGSDVSVATSGIAGPGGGTIEKPVGLVWIGVSSPRGTRTLTYQGCTERERNVVLFSHAALEALLEEVTALPGKNA